MSNSEFPHLEPITHIIELTYVEALGSTILESHWHYEPTDPCAIHVTINDEDKEKPAKWLFGRQLASDGLTMSTGQGDVRFEPPSRLIPPEKQFVSMTLSSSEGEAIFWVPRPKLLDFLFQTYRQIPTAHEIRYINLELELISISRER